MHKIKSAIFLMAAILAAAEGTNSRQPRFHLQEATIDDIHQAIRSGQNYLPRIGSALHQSRQGLQRSGRRTRHERRCADRAGDRSRSRRFACEISYANGGHLHTAPQFRSVAGPPIEFGRMEPTASDPTVQQQYGMTIGLPHAGQLNALGTLNIRGERSVTCKGDRDRRPSDGSTASRLARGVRGISQAAGCPRARRRT